MATRRRRRDAPALGGAIWVTVGGRNLGGPGRVALLRAIDALGSITHAAKAVGLSYKAAWDAVETMNAVSREPLVQRSAGGRGGGSTTLTGHGRALVARYEALEAVHRRFVALLDGQTADPERELDLLRIVNMKTSARNQFIGTVRTHVVGAVNDELEIELAEGLRLVAIVTRGSAQELGLAVGATAFALVQASSVILATGIGDARLSARNRLAGRVAAVTPGAVNAEVRVDIGGGAQLAAIVTQPSVAALGLAPGVACTALFKASDVIVGTLA